MCRWRVLRGCRAEARSAPPTGQGRTPPYVSLSRPSFLPYDFVRRKHRAFLTDTLAAVARAAAASHTPADAAPHPLLEAELPRHSDSARQRTEHRHGTAGIYIIVVRTSVRKHVGHEAAHAARTVRRSDRHIGSQRLELLRIEDFRRRIETEHHRHPPSFGQKPLRK